MDGQMPKICVQEETRLGKKVLKPQTILKYPLHPETAYQNK
jgi:hypothetical protein